MGKTSAAVKNRYIAKAYDRINLTVPKGRKADIEAFAAANGETVNGWIQSLMQNAMGLTEKQWKAKTGEESETGQQE